MFTAERRDLLSISLLLFIAFGAAGCGQRTTTVESPDLRIVVDSAAPDAAPACDPSGDWDKDGITNGEEGCLEGRDSDKDGSPDYQDFDSDGDGIQDRIEAGEKGNCVAGKKAAWPCDSDGDGIPNYLDPDSDGDGLLDGDEDRNGDGLLGCCLEECGKPQGGQMGANGCILNKDGCGGDQRCVSGKCTPPADFSCAEGETNPRLRDTFGKGKQDNTHGFFICRHGPKGGLVSVQKRRSSDPKQDQTSGDWHLALRPGATYSALSITSPKDKEDAAAMDYKGAGESAAGFVLSMAATQADLPAELAAILARVKAKPPGGGGSGTVNVYSSGKPGKSHDRYDIVRGTTLELVGVNADVSTARNELIAAILGRTPATLGALPAPFGAKNQTLIVRFATVRRFAFQEDRNGNLVLDAAGYPMEDTSRPDRRRILVMGAVATQAHHLDASRQTALIVNDLSEGTALAPWSDRIDDECDTHVIKKLPTADIIWVIDESGSMQDQRQELVDNANLFFTRALSSGLDFRVGVTNVCRRNAGASCVQGKLCSRISTDPGDDGGVDRFLLPSEQQIFSACVKNPPGYEGATEHGLDNAAEAVKRHLPRAANAPEKLRPEAATAIIIVTDEAPAELKGSVLDLQSGDTSACTLSASKQTKLHTALSSYLDLFEGKPNPDTAATVHVIGGLCQNSCNAEVAHGYRELAARLGGQLGDVCQKDLRLTLLSIVDEIIGASAPVELQYTPIAASLAVAVDGVVVKRSRTSGFDYRAENNALVFINIKYGKGSEVVVSYKRWTTQMPCC